MIQSGIIVDANYTPPPALTPELIFLAAHPVGSIYETTNESESTAAKMDTLYGGKWETYGAGKVLVGLSTEAEFNSINKEGGSKTHTLSESQMPSHTHGQEAHNHQIGSDNSLGTNAFARRGISNYQGYFATTSAQPVIWYTGGGQPHNNLQPYKVVYRYIRVE